MSLLPQDVPPVSQIPQEPPPAAWSGELLQQFQALSWVDHTALGVMLVFFVLGLWKGLIWQVSRVVILVVAYVVAARFGRALADLLARAEGADPGGAPLAPSATTVYIAYVLLFVGVLVVLSLLAMLLQRLAAKSGLTFFDRVGGGVLGVATGACTMLFGVFVVHMFFGQSQLAQAAESSHSLRLSRQAIDWLGANVPDELRGVLALAPLQAAAPAGGVPPLPGTVVEPQPPAPGVPGPVPGPVPERPKR